MADRRDQLALWRHDIHRYHTRGGPYPGPPPPPGDTTMARTTKTQKQAQRDESIRTLLEDYNLQPGDTLYTSHHEPSTYLKVFVVKPDNQGRHVPFNITWHVARALGVSPKDKNGEWFLRNGVAGMDRGFDVVYQLSRTLFRDMNFQEQAGLNITNNGYALNHRWL